MIIRIVVYALLAAAVITAGFAAAKLLARNSLSATCVSEIAAKVEMRVGNKTVTETIAGGVGGAVVVAVEAG